MLEYHARVTPYVLYSTRSSYYVLTVAVDPDPRNFKDTAIAGRTESPGRFNGHESCELPGKHRREYCKQRFCQLSPVLSNPTPRYTKNGETCGCSIMIPVIPSGYVHGRRRWQSQAEVSELFLLGPLSSSQSADEKKHLSWWTLEDLAYPGDMPQSETVRRRPETD